MSSSGPTGRARSSSPRAAASAWAASTSCCVPLDGRPLIAYSIAAFAASNEVDRLVIVTSNANYDAIGSVARQLAPDATVVLGGERRRDSVRAGIEALADVDYVLVHDGARPLVNEVMIEAALQGAVEAGAAICAVPVTDTIKRARRGRPDRRHGRPQRPCAQPRRRRPSAATCCCAPTSRTSTTPRTMPPSSSASACP